MELSFSINTSLCSVLMCVFTTVLRLLGPNPLSGFRPGPLCYPIIVSLAIVASL